MTVDDPLPALDVMVEDQAWTDAIASLTDLALRCHKATGDVLQGGLPGNVCLLLTRDCEVRALNARFRNKDRPTNVLSFPGDQNAGQLGDIAMAFETCEREAIDAGLPISHHAAHLIVHGLLHLVGYDHINDADAVEMETLETEILASLQIANPYLEASTGRSDKTNAE